MQKDMKQSGEQADLVWNIAWSWARRQPLQGDAELAALNELACWLAADPAHRKAYQKACKLWLLAGLVPPVNDVPIPGAPDASDPDPEQGRPAPFDSH